MALYKLTGNDSFGEKIGAIIRTTDNASIPLDEENMDYVLEVLVMPTHLTIMKKAHLQQTLLMVLTIQYKVVQIEDNI